MFDAGCGRSEGGDGAQAQEAPIRLMLVEDDAESGKALQHLLEKRGVCVSFVPSAEEALAQFDAAMFDVIVADIRLKGMSGVDLLREVRGRMPDFPLILLTGFDSLESAIQAVRLGAQDYILKPLESVEDILVPARNAVCHHRLLLRNRALADEIRRNEQRLRQMASELAVAEERERRRLALELHDGIGQSLALVKLKLDEVAGGDPGGRTQAEMETIREFILEAIQQIRTLTFDLSPPSLYELGLEAALDDLAERVQRQHGIVVGFSDDNEPKPVDEVLRVQVFRAVRELLFNVVKHARAHRASISVSRDTGRLRVVVADDGVGFDVEQAFRDGGSGGFGLFSIRERFRTLGGGMVIASGKGRGTTVTLTAPLRDA